MLDNSKEEEGGMHESGTRGLGLYNSLRICEALQGSISCKSIPNERTEFKFKVVATSDPPSNEILENIDEDSGEEEKSQDGNVAFSVHPY